MARFEIVFVIHPPYAFGIPSDGHDVVPAGVNPTFHAEWDTGRHSLTREDGSSTARRPDEMLRTSMSLNGVTFSVEDNIFRAKVVAHDIATAVNRTSNELTRLLALYSASLNAPGFQLTPQVVGIAMDGVPVQRDRDSWSRFYVYDNPATSRELNRLAERLEGLPTDRDLTRALRYLGIGDALLSLFPAGMTDDQIQSITPVRFLQYWKALTAIVGDPSSDRDHQARPRQLGLGRQFFRQKVRPMNEIRDKFDVAHVANPAESRVASPEDADKCRAVAVEAITAHVNRLREEAGRV